MESTIIIAAISLLALLGAGLTAWGMWLEHRAEGRVMDIVAAAIEAKQPVPGELLARLAGERPRGNAAPRRALLRTATLLFGLAIAFFLGSWAIGDNAREQALLLLASISGLTGLVLLG